MTHGSSHNIDYHVLPLHLLSHGERYTVHDVLGVLGAHPNIEHHRNRVPNIALGPVYSMTADALHSRTNSSGDPAAFVTLRGGGSGSGISTPTGLSTGNISSIPGGGNLTPPPNNIRKKTVGFAQPPTPYRHHPSTPSGTSHTKQSVHLSNTDGLVVVSVFLPVNLKRSDDGQWTADWDYEMLLSMQTHLRVTRIGVVKWRGWHGNIMTTRTTPNTNTNVSSDLGGSPEAGVPRSERHLVEECLRPFHCVPVWVDPTLFGEMYNGFCKGVLWPVLHNVTSVYTHRPDDNTLYGTGHRPSYDTEEFSDYSMDDVEQGPIHGGRGREAELWGAYNTVNRQFAEVVVQCFNEGDLVWIHGFHLLILPSYLARRIPMAKVGIFLHTPFPSSEIFRTLWCREDLLRGMLNADQVGFHLFEYARHFLTSCRRLLGLNYGMIPDSSGGHTLAIDTNGRNVAVTSIHAGVEPPVLNQILTHGSTLEKAASIRRRMEGKHVCCAIDRLESLKGIPLKLLGLERFLSRCPEWVGKIVLVQIGISAFERGDDYFRTKREVQRLVDKINSQWPETVQFQECTESGMGLQQRMALLRAADTVVVTAIRDGLNLLPLEYTIAHQDAMTELGRKDGRKRGLCILSEFSSCTRVMRGALHVNPWKISEIANAYLLAVSIGEDERLRRISIASEFVTRVTTQRWALAVMLDLKGVYKNINPVQYSGAGLGLGFRLLGMNTGFTSLDTNVLAKAYTNAKARLFLIDYGGTIVSNDNVRESFWLNLVNRQPVGPINLTHSFSSSFVARQPYTVSNGEGTKCSIDTHRTND
jgi:trehalose 6-phosphate synthase/phosphatase